MNICIKYIINAFIIFSKVTKKMHVHILLHFYHVVTYKETATKLQNKLLSQLDTTLMFVNSDEKIFMRGILMNPEWQLLPTQSHPSPVLPKFSIVSPCTSPWGNRRSRMTARNTNRCFRMTARNTNRCFRMTARNTNRCFRMTARNTNRCFRMTARNINRCFRMTARNINRCFRMTARNTSIANVNLMQQLHLTSCDKYLTHIHECVHSTHASNSQHAYLLDVWK